jgi:hypothetical protein
MTPTALLIAAAQPTMLDDNPTLANTVRVFNVTVGLIFAAVAGKVALMGWWRQRGGRQDPDGPDVLGALAFCLAIAVPAVNGLFRFDGPLLAYTTVLYSIALLLSIASTARRVTLRHRR